MPLDAPQADWLSQASGISISPAGATPGKNDDGKAKLKRKLAEEAVADQERKTLLINDAMRLIDPLRPMLSEAFDLQVTNAKGKTKQLQAKDGDLGKSVESRDMRGTDTVSRGGSKKPKKGEAPTEDPSKLVQEAGRAYHIIEQIKVGLEKETTTSSQLNPKTGELFDGPAQPLFTSTEIMDELYTPLIRARILPDTVVEGKFSKVQQMLDATNELYKQELVDAEDPNSGAAALAKGMIEFGKNLAEPIMQAAGVDSKLAMTLLEGCTALVETSVDLGDKVHSGLNAGSIKDFFSGLPGIIGTMVGSATGNQELGKAIGSAGSAGVSAVAIIITSVQAKKPDVKGLIAFFSDVLSEGLGQIDSGDTGDALAKLGDDLQKLIAEAAGSHCDEFFEAVASGDPKRARKACRSMCIDIAVSMPSLGSDIFGAATSTVDKPDGVDDTVDSIQETSDEVQKIISENKEATEELKKKLEEEASDKFAALEKNVDEADKKREKDKPDAEKDPEKFAASVKQELDDAKKEFLDQLNGLNDPTTDQKTVMKLIAKIQKDRAIISVAVAIAQGGVNIASHFFGPVAIAGEAIKMAANMAAAVERAVYLRKFIDEKIGAQNATSPYLSSIQNFVENQANQMTHYAIAAALNGVKIAAAAAATAHPAAAPALPIVSAIQSATEVLYQFYNANQVRKAWNVTKAALQDPQNRSLGLKARKVNPTLAKYAIAYGSTVERDPIAVSMANACGLDNETLKNKETNVVKVKIYLEVKFSDDNKVVGRYSDAPGWADKLPEAAMDVGVVFRTYEIISDSAPYKSEHASKAAKPPGDLVALMRTLQKQKLPEPPTADLVSERLTVAGQVTGIFRTQVAEYGPLDDEIEAALDAFVDVAENEQEKLAMQLVKLKVAEAKATPGRR